MLDLHFLHPWWLVGAALCLVLGVLGRNRRSTRSEWYRVIDSKLAPALIRSHWGRYSLGAVDLLWLMLLLGMLALSGPTWNRQLPDELQDQAAVVVVLGNQPSMYAGDIAPNRSRAAKAKIQALRQLMPQSSFSVIVYANTAHLVIPLTRDDSFFDLFLQPLEPDIMPKAVVSRSGLALALDRARQIAGTADMPVNVILMTDSLPAQERADLGQFQKEFPSLEVLIIGTAEGGPLRFAPGGLTATGGTQVPLDDFAALKEAGMNVTSIATDDRDVAWLARHIRGAIEQSRDSDAHWHWQDSGYWLVLLMLPLGLLLCRQITLLGLAAPLIVLLSGTYSTDASADWKSLWWTPDQLGQQAMDKGDYQGAGELFIDSYRKGRAYYLAKDYPKAVDAFRQVKSAQGYFYLANSLAQQQRYQAALKYYRQALLIHPSFTQASANAKAVKSVLDELRKQPSERQMTDDAESADVSSIQIDLSATQKSEQEPTSASRMMSEDELNNWMANVKSSPREMLKALFLLQSQELHQPEAP
ncbi:tetratricopeptide repeat protein [Enterobacterales bacterium AE_CKDN230030158-1A_HGKHYDSX7]